MKMSFFQFKSYNFFFFFKKSFECFFKEKKPMLLKCLKSLDNPSVHLTHTHTHTCTHTRQKRKRNIIFLAQNASKIFSGQPNFCALWGEIPSMTSKYFSEFQYMKRRNLKISKKRLNVWYSYQIIFDHLYCFCLFFSV